MCLCRDSSIGASPKSNGVRCTVVFQYCDGIHKNAKRSGVRVDRQLQLLRHRRRAFCYIFGVAFTSGPQEFC